MLLGAKASSGGVTAALAWLLGKLILHRFEWFLLQYFLQHATQIKVGLQLKGLSIPVFTLRPFGSDYQT